MSRRKARQTESTPGEIAESSYTAKYDGKDAPIDGTDYVSTLVFDRQ